ncbi:MAG: PilZ domain-containing protein [Candidatus Thiodiazotropha sp. (ex Dulcina madagascariensis)]|nr:PilZ domain-containing protein [Candidatus Thiodiazotropha sp. (ex Dulcina madagascariensis)]MCU7926949.1 PilZ domain-containing protein [Candidatus Thiodiazotropha sp. (ex Dulcina madagascariensis)]
MSNEEREQSQDERREFFRIDDSIRVSYRVITAEELPESIDDQLHGDDRFTVMTRLQALSQHLSAPLHRIEQRDPDVADYLKVLDEKINLLGQSLLAEERGLLDRPSQSVNLSAGGLAMDITESLQEGDLVEIKLLLLPSYTGVVAYGEVVGVDDSTEGDADYPYHIRINFNLIRNSDQDALIRHIMRRQGEMLRQRRERQDLENG